MNLCALPSRAIMSGFPKPMFNVARDAPDLRDVAYRPSLQPLPRELLPRRLLARIRCRNQGAEGTCTGQALATIVDILREREEPAPPELVAPASARMLFELARDIEQRGNGSPAATDGTVSLRSTLKAFYHHGVCLDEHWPYVEGGERGGLTKPILDEAHKLALGAYYRVRPNLNDIHAALGETGAILAAAAVHDGWLAERVRRNRGRIPFATDQVAASGGHAFAIVGYDGEGFLVLNSWGEDWGGFKDVPGLGHWSYADWAANILDAWVLRLAVPTPKAFDYTIGSQGIDGGLNIPIAAGSVPRISIVGHYLHLDDGAHVSGGPYSSSQGSLDATVDHLTGQDKRKYDDVLIWLAGANEGTKDAVADIARLKPVWMNRRIYPITILWCTDFVDSVADVLDGVFATAAAQIDVPCEALDRLIEARLRGPGRAFLRDIKRASAKSVRQPITETMMSLRRLSEAGYRLHVVAEGVGAVLLADLAVASASRRQRLLPFESVTLLAPALTQRRFRRLAKEVAHLGSRSFVLATAGPDTESRMRSGPYRGSILHLIDRAFEDEPTCGQIVGLHDVARSVSGTLPAKWQPQLAILDPGDNAGRVQLRQLTRGNSAIDLLLERAFARPLPSALAPLCRNTRAL